ncbi:helix-turn-helix domain-containing protein [uncultured Modestobacter sp.]|uniref:helix-turn-helix domain-containing protein n=1 Tax=uncultured Modestobacter sp. TaxID=380048 RepID=UPI00261D1C02|nr:helix-turn-helix domain-containing protein [uncultured Modestobacter sp.]
MDEPQLLRDGLAEHPLLLTTADAATVLSISRTTVYTLIKDGALRPVHIGRSCRLSRTELLRYVDGLETHRETEPH